MEITAKSLSRIAASFSQPLNLTDRLLNTYRPFICPFHRIMGYLGSDDRVLDIGCGTGLWLNLLARTQGLSFGHGVEVNTVKVELANRVKSTADALQFSAIGPEEDWPTGDFNCLTMIDVLHHVPRREQSTFMRRIDRTHVSKVIFKDIDPAAFLKSKMNTLHDLILSRELPRYCRKEVVAAWLEEMGFQIDHVGRHDMLWYSHYLIVAKRQ